MNIRPALSGEAAALTEIAFAAKRHWGYPETWINRWSEALTVRDADIVAGSVFVAEADPGRELVGFGALLFEPDAAVLEHLWVLPRFMGRGAGRALFLHAERMTKARGLTRLRCIADPHAEAFYLRMGAVTCDRLPAGVDGVERMLPVMEKRV